MRAVSLSGRGRAKREKKDSSQRFSILLPLVPSLTLRYLLRYLKDPAQTDPTLVSVDSFCGARTATPTQLIDHYRRQAFELLRIRRSKRLRPRDGKEKKEFVDPYRKSSLG